jgi:hypothetical protein
MRSERESTDELQEVVAGSEVVVVIVSPTN